MSLSIVKPMVINSSNMTTNIPIPDVNRLEYLWNSTFDYEVGELVLSSVADPYLSPINPPGIYQAVTGGVHNTNPANDPVNWKFVRLANRYLMFDNNSISTTFAVGETIDVNVAVFNKPLSYLALYGLQNAASVTITLTQHTTNVVLMTKTIGLQRPPLQANWYSYFWDEITLQPELHVPLPTYRNVTINVVINSGSYGGVGCANMLLGSSVVLSDDVEFGAEMGIRDYSRKEKDEDTGADTLVRRGYSKHLSMSFLVKNNSRPAIVQYLTELRAVPVIFIADQIDAVYGYYQDYKVTVPYLNESICTLTIEGLTQ